MGAPALMQLSGLAEAGSGHDHAPEHDRAETAKAEIAKGWFEDGAIAPRALSDWEGEWQSVYPLLTSGALDEVMAHKAAHGDKSAGDYHAYHQTGYKTDVTRIVIVGEQVAFHRGEAVIEGVYAADGHEILTYEKGNRGVRLVFAKIAGDEAAPQYNQFSDHRISPEKADHYHLYWGEDRAQLLTELTNWPTCYPAVLSADEIVAEMLVH